MHRIAWKINLTVREHLIVIEGVLYDVYDFVIVVYRKKVNVVGHSCDCTCLSAHIAQIRFINGSSHTTITNYEIYNRNVKQQNYMF